MNIKRNIIFAIREQKEKRRANRWECTYQDACCLQQSTSGICNYDVVVVKIKVCHNFQVCLKILTFT